MIRGVSPAVFAFLVSLEREQRLLDRSESDSWFERDSFYGLGIGLDSWSAQVWIEASDETSSPAPCCSKWKVMRRETLPVAHMVIGQDALLVIASVASWARLAAGCYEDQETNASTRF